MANNMAKILNHFITVPCYISPTVHLVINGIYKFFVVFLFCLVFFYFFLWGLGCWFMFSGVFLEGGCLFCFLLLCLIDFYLTLKNCYAPIQKRLNLYFHHLSTIGEQLPFIVLRHFQAFLCF